MDETPSAFVRKHGIRKHGAARPDRQSSGNLDVLADAQRVGAGLDRTGGLDGSSHPAEARASRVRLGATSRSKDRKDDAVNHVVLRSPRRLPRARVGVGGETVEAKKLYLSGTQTVHIQVTCFIWCGSGVSAVGGFESVSCSSLVCAAARSSHPRRSAGASSPVPCARRVLPHCCRRGAGAAPRRFARARARRRTRRGPAPREAGASPRPRGGSIRSTPRRCYP